MEKPETIIRIDTVCLVTIAAVCVGAALYWLAPMMIPFTLALFCAFVLTQVADMLMKHCRFPRVLAIATAVLLAIGIFVVMGTLVSSSLRSMASNIDSYQESGQQLIEDVIQGIPFERFGIDISSELDNLSKLPVGNLGNVLLGTTNAVLDLLKRSVLVLIFVIFLLIGWKGNDPELPGVGGEIQANVRRFLATKTVLSATTGFLVGLILWSLGVDLALVFGLFAFLLNFIPSIGSIIATLLPLPLVLVSPGATNLTIILAIVLPGAVQIGIGNFLEPKIMGDSLDLHPVTILLSLIFWGMLWGVVGAFLATPISAIIKILLSRHEVTKPVALLMGGNIRPLLQTNSDKDP